jgi:hypothetical protein
MSEMSDIPKTCKAAILVEYEKPLEIWDVQVPSEIQPGAVLVKNNVATICGSDLHLWEGATKAVLNARLPVILGHEVVGTVVKLGEDVNRTAPQFRRPHNLDAYRLRQMLFLQCNETTLPLQKQTRPDAGEL